MFFVFEITAIHLGSHWKLFTRTLSNQNSSYNNWVCLEGHQWQHVSRWCGYLNKSGWYLIEIIREVGAFISCESHHLQIYRVFILFYFI
jgi:hypothetical protein